MKNILVFPCGSEIALEIFKALEFSIHFNLIGASSVKDHGEYIFKNYIPNLPFHNEKEFIPIVKKVIKEYKIDAIYPAMDLVAYTLKQHENELDCKVISSEIETTKICSDKELIYNVFKNKINTPKIFNSIEDAIYPLFIKPSIGYGSRNVFLAKTIKEANNFLEEKKNLGKFLLCEYLPYEEYTIDCFSNKKGELLYSQARQRARISNGISVNTYHVKKHHKLFYETARVINKELNLRGAWFFQMKEDKQGMPKLLEIATRLGGSSSLCRVKGINFPLLTLFDAFDIEVDILENNYDIELDRALSNKYKLTIEYSTIYIDYDDCILFENIINYKMISFIYKSINENKKIILLTKHNGDIFSSLKKFRLDKIFDEVFHLKKEEKKSDYIINKNSIFIDDSHQERVEVSKAHSIPVFSPDMIEVFL